MSRVGVLGAGSWGTALAVHLARTGSETVLWARREEAAAAMASARENAPYLPGCRLPDGLEVTVDLEAAIADRDLVLCVAPAQASRDLFRRVAPGLRPQADLVIASKGIEEVSGLRMTEVLEQEAGADRSLRAAVLSGPSFAAEVARGDPTAVVVASADGRTAARAQAVISAGNLRVYTQADPVGVEVAGAIKNVMAIAAGVVEGIGLGFNTRAALITRGLAEIARLGVALGGRPETFAGLAGAGDLILTCTGALSRNRALGVEIGRGRRLQDALAGRRAVVEGVPTTRAAAALAERAGIEMPIVRQVHGVLFEGRPPRAAIDALMARPLREEW